MAKMKRSLTGGNMIQSSPKKTRQGTGKHTKYAASSRNEARKTLQRTRKVMSQLVINLPAQKVWVRKEYLRDLKDGYGEFVEGVWVTG